MCVCVCVCIIMYIYTHIYTCLYYSSILPYTIRMATHIYYDNDSLFLTTS